MAPTEDKKKVNFNVVNKGENLHLSPEQVLGAYLNKLKRFFTNGDEKPDVVLAVPPYFSAVER